MAGNDSITLIAQAANLVPIENQKEGLLLFTVL